MEGIELNKVTFECYRNGAKVILPFQKAYRLLWESSLGWVVPSRFFRCRVPGLIDTFYVSDRISTADIKTLFVLFCRQCVAVTEHDLGTTHGG
jgi:hypothetical protein